VQQLRSQQISVGEDFRLAGSAVELPVTAIAGSFGIPVTIVPLHTCEGERTAHPSAKP